MSDHRRIPGLDGLRAIGVWLVLVCHSVLTTTVVGGYVVADNRYVLMLGDWGVRLFFILSGFLITTLLVREKTETGTISLKGFMMRRVRRIMPAFFTYIIVVGVLGAAGVIALPRDEILGAALYVMNFMDPREWWLSHTWSLAVEEQFYLLWPTSMILSGVAKAPYVAMFAVIAAPIFRVGAQIWWPSLDDEVGKHAFPFVFDSLASGCLLALWKPRLEAFAPYKKLLDSGVFWIVPIVLIGSMAFTEPHVGMLARPKIHALAMSLANVGIALAIHRIVTHPAALVTRVLETRVFVWFGTISYSLYLWQQPFVNRYTHAVFTQLPVSYACAVVAASLSYYLVERPILRRGRRGTLPAPSALRGSPTST